jgi:hypothetical protein
MIDYSKLKGIEQLRMAASILDNCNESFNFRHSAQELLRLVEVMTKCDWDISPDYWEEFQITAALEYGTVPEFRHFTKEDYSTTEHYRCGSAGMVPVFPEGYHSELAIDSGNWIPDHFDAAAR